MSHADKPVAGLSRRAALFVPVACLGAGAVVSCSRSPKVPEGWVRKEKGLLSVAVPAQWQEVAIPEGARVSSWDWVLQDTSDFNDSATTVRLLGMSEGPGAVIVYPPTDAVEAAEALGAVNLFGDSDRAYPEAREVDGGEDEVQRVDMPYGGGEGNDYLLVAKDKESGLMAVVGLTGTGVTEELIADIAAGIQVVVPD
ncbi:MULTISPECIES: hypothetical protein [Actinomyces]|uniref:Uncharacterized protein n=1 Tax=Actinomyces respiraculi TaxID=2744574 RepID=A0A7T0LJX3_9ACTO|nr:MULTISPECIES: hypothetical protein [Actinomyces]QPL05012.1 hypothetical protein ID810_09725 [Actinomyces respiraculi]